jgi:transcriptional regulator with XRE-family HTH domain
MQLAQWLTQHGVSYAAFGKRIGRSRAAVERYAKGARMPDSSTMPRIVAETDGAVTANDFYAAPRSAPPEAA